MRKANNKKQVKVGWIILGILFIFILFVGSFCIAKPLNYDQAIEKANQYQKQELYCSGYHYEKADGGICTLYFKDQKTLSIKKDIVVENEDIARRIYNEYQR